MVSDVILIQEGETERLDLPFFIESNLTSSFFDTIGCVYPKTISKKFDNRRIKNNGKLSWVGSPAISV